MIGCLFDLLFLLTVILSLLGLTLDGYITTDQCVLFIISFVILRAITRAFGVRLGRLIFSIGTPIALLLIFSITYGHGQIGDIFRILGILLPLLIVAFGLYIMLVGSLRK